MKYAIQAPTLFDGEKMLERRCIVVEDQHVVDSLRLEDVPDGIPVTVLDEGVIAPGFVDLQVNGGGGVLFNNTPTPESIDVITASHRASGTTAMMPTFISDTAENQKLAVASIRKAQAAGNKGVLGIHLEGPFFDIARRGAHRADMIRKPDSVDMEWLRSLDDLQTIVTLAPEHIPAGQIQSLADAGILVCAGHSNASYQQIESAVDEGLRGFTHLYNAMSPLTSREPGVVGAALDFDKTWAGIIVDGHHVHTAAIKLAHTAKPSGKLFLVSDAMASVNSGKTDFELYGGIITEENGRLVNAEGVLAGSAIGMIDAVRNCNTLVGLPFEECLRMASLYPAQFIQRDDKFGRIAPGFRADFVHFDDSFRVLGTWVAGSYRAENPS